MSIKRYPSEKQKWLLMLSVMCNAKSQPDLVDCPSSGTVFLSHPTSCSKFIMCLYGEITVAQCREGSYFNSITQVCDIPADEGCHLDEKVDSEENADSIEDDENRVPEDDPSAEADPPAEAELPECPKEGIHFFPHPSSCSRFIQCNAGVYRIVNCIEGYYFNSKLGWCDTASNVNCTIEEDSKQPDDNGDLLECPSAGRYFLPHPRSCSKFVKCDEGSHRVINCVDGQYFDSTFGWCDISSKVDCTIEDEQQSDEDSETTFECTGITQKFYPHPKSCYQFIECNFGQYRVHDCIFGLHFNPLLGHCDFPSNVNCVI